MKTLKGFIIKSKLESGQTLFNHLRPSELHLIKSILKDSKDGLVEIKETTFTNDNNFITQRF